MVEPNNDGVWLCWPPAVLPNKVLAAAPLVLGGVAAGVVDPRLPKVKVLGAAGVVEPPGADDWAPAPNNEPPAGAVLPPPKRLGAALEVGGCVLDDGWFSSFFALNEKGPFPTAPPNNDDVLFPDVAVVVGGNANGDCVLELP